MKKISFKPKFKNNIGTDAFTDWVIILSVTLLGSIFLIGVGSYVYTNTEASLDSHGTNILVSNKPNFDTQLLKKVIDAFDARANERVLLSSGYTGPKDPSLP